MFCAKPHPLDPAILCGLPVGHDGVHNSNGEPEPGPGWTRERPYQPSVSTMQRKILEFIRDHMAEHGFPPSVREVGDHVGLRSTSSVAHQLRELERKGYVRRMEGKARALKVTLPEEVAG